MTIGRVLYLASLMSVGSLGAVAITAALMVLPDPLEPFWPISSFVLTHAAFGLAYAALVFRSRTDEFPPRRHWYINSYAYVACMCLAVGSGLLAFLLFVKVMNA